MKTKEIITHVLSKNISKILYCILTIIISATLQVFSILILRNLIDNTFPNAVTEETRLAFWVTSFIVSTLLMIGFNILSKNLITSISTNLQASLVNAAYTAVIKSEISEFEKFDAKKIAKRIIDDANYISDVYLRKNWYLYVHNIIHMLAYYITMIVISPLLGLISLGCLPIYYMLVRSFDKYYTKANTKATNYYLNRDNKIFDDLENLRSIKLRNGINFEEERMAKMNDGYVEIKKNHSFLSDFKDNNFFNILMSLFFALILGVGGYYSTRIEAITGTIVSVLIMSPIAFYMLSMLMKTSILPSMIANELQSLEEIISIRSEIKVEPITSLDEIHSFKFQNVTYSVNEVNLTDINFDLKRGEKLGILVLDNNVDKVMFDLLTKLVRPKEGSITINNCDYNKINTIYLRSLITAIPDERNLFNDSIQNNITYPLKFDEYKYNDALNKSGLKDLLNTLPEKDQTILEKNIEVTEELKQRIIFANAFYKDSKIFILNETNSTLTPKDEEDLIHKIFDLKNKITIVITDKNYSVLKCDKVLILNKDEVLEYGKVEDLLNDKQSVLNSLIKKVKIVKSAKAS